METTPQGPVKAGAKKTAKRRLRHLKVKKAANGGYLVTHHFKPEHGGTPKPEEHVFGSYDDAHGHIETTMRGHR